MSSAHALGFWNELKGALTNMHEKTGFCVNEIDIHHVLVKFGCNQKRFPFALSLCSVDKATRIGYPTSKVGLCRTPYWNGSFPRTFLTAEIYDFQLLVKLMVDLMQGTESRINSTFDLPLDQSTGNIFLDQLIRGVWNCSGNWSEKRVMFDTLYEKAKDFGCIHLNKVFVGEYSDGPGCGSFDGSKYFICFPERISQIFKNFSIGSVATVLTKGDMYFAFANSMQSSFRESSSQEVYVFGPLFDIKRPMKGWCQVRRIKPHLVRARLALNDLGINFKFNVFPERWASFKLALNIMPKQAFLMCKFLASHGLTKVETRNFGLWGSLKEHAAWIEVKGRVERE